MFEELLAMLDSGPGDEATLRATQHLARAFGSRVTLLMLPPEVHVADRAWESHAGRRRRHRARSSLSRRASQLEEALDGSSHGPRRIRTVLGAGRPLQEAQRLVHLGDIDGLVLSASFGEPSLAGGRALQGRLALSRLGTSVLVTRPDPPEGPRPSTVLVPLDGSERSEWILGAAVRLALELRAHLCLAHVVVPPELLPPGAAAGPAAELARRVVEGRRRQASRYLAGWKARLERDRLEVRTLVRAGPSVASALLELADDTGSGLFVLSDRESGVPGPWTPGRVAGQLLQYARNSVLALHEGAPRASDRVSRRVTLRLEMERRRFVPLDRGRPRRADRWHERSTYEPGTGDRPGGPP